MYSKKAKNQRNLLIKRGKNKINPRYPSSLTLLPQGERHFYSTMFFLPPSPSGRKGGDEGHDFLSLIKNPVLINFYKWNNMVSFIGCHFKNISSLCKFINRYLFNIFARIIIRHLFINITFFAKKI